MELKEEFKKELEEYKETFEKLNKAKADDTRENEYQQKLKDFNEKYPEDIFPTDIPIRDEEARKLDEEKKAIKEEKDKVQEELKDQESNFRDKIIDWQKQIADRRKELVEYVTNKQQYQEEKDRLEKELESQREGIKLWEQNGIDKEDKIYDRRKNVVIPNLEKQISELNEKLDEKSVREQYKKLGELSKKIEKVKFHSMEYIIPELADIFKDENEKDVGGPDNSTKPASTSKDPQQQGAANQASAPENPQQQQQAPASQTSVPKNPQQQGPVNQTSAPKNPQQSSFSLADDLQQHESTYQYNPDFEIKNWDVNDFAAYIPNGPQQQGAANQTSTQSGSQQQGAANQTSTQSGSQQQGAANQTSTQSGSQQQGAASQTSAQNGPQQQGAASQTSAQNGSQQQGAASQTSAQNGSQQQGTASQASVQNGSQQQGTGSGTQKINFSDLEIVHYAENVNEEIELLKKNKEIPKDDILFKMVKYNLKNLLRDLRNYKNENNIIEASKLYQELTNYDIIKEVRKVFEKQKSEAEASTDGHKLATNRKLFNEMRETVKKLGIRDLAKAQLNVPIIKTEDTDLENQLNDEKNVEIRLGRRGKIILGDGKKYKIPRREMKNAYRFARKDIMTEILNCEGLRIFDIDSLAGLIALNDTEINIDPTVIYGILHSNMREPIDKAKVLNAYLSDCLASKEGIRFDNRCDVLYKMKDLSRIGFLPLEEKKVIAERAELLEGKKLATVYDEFKPSIISRVFSAIRNVNIPKLVSRFRTKPEELSEGDVEVLDPEEVEPEVVDADYRQVEDDKNTRKDVRDDVKLGAKYTQRTNDVGRKASSQKDSQSQDSQARQQAQDSQEQSL